jgi:glycosyltransferase involved in cell wall biosynthesis
VDNTQKIAIVIPAYNESNTITDVVQDIKNELSQLGLAFEVIVVDDGSTDDTAQKATSQGATVIKHILNSGSGSATATGLRFAQLHNFSIAATMDADGQHNPKDVVRGIALIQSEGGDLLLGSRLIDVDGMSRVKILGNRGLSLITYILFGVNVTDSQSGLRIFSSRALHKLKWKTSGYEFCSEMLWRAKQKGLRITEYPIQAIYTDYSKSKGQNNWNAVNIIKTLLQRRLLELFGE